MANLIKCKDCGKKVSVNATTCPNCGAPVVIPEKTEKPKNVKYALLGLIVLLLLSLALCSTNSEKKDKESVEPQQAKTTEAVANNNTAVVEDVPIDNGLTNQQKNALRSAKNYISINGFSRDGLIQQLSSEYGDGYSVEDATVAVDSLNIDYNEQAAKSAKAYLDMTGFSCDGLKQQLSSKAGDKYTASQAEYGAKSVGACD